MTVLVRPNAWWFSKVPLSILLFLLLAGESSLSATILPLAGLVATVCCVGNYGFAINDLFDQEEDRIAGKANAATTHGARTIWASAIVSAILAVVVAAVSAGLAGGLLTVAAMLLPLIYSVPPLRVKERGWFGVLADALAAHLFPALLAMLIVSRHALQDLTIPLLIAITAWSLVTGLRNILAHQLKTAERDRVAGLTTLAHTRGHWRLVQVVGYVIVPVEYLAFATIIYLTGPTAFILLVAAVFVSYELLKYYQNIISIDVFKEKSRHFIPFMDEGAYRVWGPIALTIDAAFSDPSYYALALLYIFLFLKRARRETRQIRRTGKRLYKSVRKAYRHRHNANMGLRQIFVRKGKAPPG